MDLFQSIQTLAETAGLSYDAALLLFGKAVFIYEVCKSAVFGVAIWGVWHFLNLVLNRKTRNK